MLHSVHGCLRWCLWDSVVSGTWWLGTSSCITSHTFIDTQQKWSTMKQEAYGIYYAVTKWNYCLLGSDIVICNDHKPLQKFLNGKNANNKVNRLSLELATYNITFECISGTLNKAADCHSWLIEVKNTPATPTASINMLVISTLNGPATCTCSKTCSTANTTLITDNVPPPLTEDQKETLRLMQRTDPFCKHISKRLLSDKEPSHEIDTFTWIKGLIYKQVLAFYSTCWSSWQIRTPRSQQNLSSCQTSTLLERHE